MAYDPKCEELARYFLPAGASERLVAALAQSVQNAVEDWCEFEQKRLREQIDKQERKQ